MSNDGAEKNIKTNFKFKLLQTTKAPDFSEAFY